MFTPTSTAELRFRKRMYAGGTGENAPIKALDTLLRNFDLTDLWTNYKDRPIYRHYRSHDASRLDRVYMSVPPARHKQGTEIFAAAFTDDLAVVLRIHLDAPFMAEGWVGIAQSVQSLSTRWRSGNQMPVGSRFSAPVHTGTGAQPASYTVGTSSVSLQ